MDSSAYQGARVIPTKHHSGQSLGGSPSVSSWTGKRKEAGSPTSQDYILEVPRAVLMGTHRTLRAGVGGEPWPKAQVTSLC